MAGLEVGMTREGSETVEERHFASGVFAAAPDVYSTPALGALVERTAAGWLDEHVAEGETTVGAQIVINHAAPTPAGMTVTVTVRVEAIEGPRRDFSWTASDGVDEIGSGTHQRFVVDSARFLGRVEKKQRGGT